MGKYLGKSKGVVGEIAAVGVSTRARAALAMAAATNSASSLPAKKIRKSAAATTRYNTHNLSSHRRVVVTSEENSASSSPSCLPETLSSSDVVVVVETAANCSSGEVSSDFPASCCSSNSASNSDEMVMDRFGIMTDQEVESAHTSSMHLHCPSEARRSESKLGVAEADKLDSPPRFPDAKSTVQIKMPSDWEIEEFFATAEKDLQKRFGDKYNFDVVEDVPLEGRYEWVPIKP